MTTHLVLFFALTAPLIAAEPTTPQQQAADILNASGVQGGVVVHIGCGDGKLTAALRANERFLVHGLDPDPQQVDAARKHIQSLGLYGNISVQQWSGDRLPYVDHFVNLAVVRGSATVDRSELMRVLCPGGVAVFVTERGRLISDQLVKPWPEEIDDWTHFLHSPDNNAVASDRRVDIPRSIQWVSQPRWGRSHEELASLSAAVTARGRMFFIVDEAPLASIRFAGDWQLVARDAFNGTLLWKRPLGTWVDHLRHFRSGPTHLPRRLVAVGDRVFVTPNLDGPVIALDAATGQTMREYVGTENTEEILAADGVLYLAVGTSEVDRRGGGLFVRGEPAPAGFRFIAAVEAETGKFLWKIALDGDDYLLPLTLAVKGSRVYFQTSGGIVSLDARSGEQVWKTARTTPARRMAFSAPTLVATDDVVLVADLEIGQAADDKPAAGPVEWGVHGWNEPGFARQGKSVLRAYAAADGTELWSAPCREGYNSPVDVFVIDGVVWAGSDFRGLDLKTGEPVKQINTQGPKVGMPHHRCYRNKASERFIFTGKSGIEVLSLDAGWLSNNSWIRGTCQYGIIPANGLLYAPPNACACFLTVKADGFFAAAPQRDPTGHMPFPDRPVLETGPLYGKLPPTTASPAVGQWPMYRHDPQRSGAGTSEIPDAVRELWCASLGGRLTQPVIADGRVFVASTDAHTVHALADDDGREIWRFTAGGRIDSPPTIWKQTAIFGSADGWIYCVGAADGALVWRFRAAPAERFVGVYGQLESIWPVHGAVLVQNDTVYATAGRSTYLDGGIVLYRLDPATGHELSKSTIYHLDPDTGQQLVPEARFNMEGTTNDILSGDGDSVFLKYFAFDRAGVRTDTTQPHLFSITGLLGEDWFVRTYWILGEGMPGAGWSGWANAANTYPSGRILSFTNDAVYGYGREKVAGGAVGHRADAYRLFGMMRTGAAPAAAEPARRKPANKTEPLWTDPQSLIVRAMVLGQDRLAVAGPRDLGEKAPDLLAFTNEPEARAGFEGRKGVYLRIVRAADGSTVSESELPAMPVFDGLAAANDRLYLSTLDGRVLCLADTE
ncbi:MAG: PQQ-binding-like beta-propeller repeat protein [Alphaproteobacteria bacterium]|nr:PQQ-binding-like beta-propeller repeat protein [Alphaproteobacteria bacterium]